jgi:multicomponent Na+:H+ antiporter subunit G
MRELLIAILLICGSGIMLIGSIGILRMPDLFSRMQATTKSMTLGAACLLLAVAVHFDQTGVGVRALLIIAFYCLTSPIAAHMIGRAAYLIGVPLWSGTTIDELRHRYDRKGHTLSSGPGEMLSDERCVVDDTGKSLSG